MVVQHNITAMNANRMLGLTTGSLAKSTEKLSSGYRINRAADDAAGLSISEKMRKQIRGLDRASTNAEDGISAVQTAEGALTEVHSMLQRMNELAVQASNGTMSADDRQAVQDEIDQLVTEVDRVSETTKFNETYLLKGDGTTTTTEKVTNTPLSVTYKTAPTATVSTTKKDNEISALGLYEAGATNKIDTADGLKNLFEVKDGNIVLKAGKSLYSSVADTTNQYGKQLTPEEVSKVIADAGLQISSTAMFDSTSGKEVKEEDLSKYFNTDGTYKGGLSKIDDKGAMTQVGAEQVGTFLTITAETTKDVEVTTPNALEFNLHVGAESKQANKISVTIDAMSAKGIGIDGLKTTGLMTEDDATASIDVIGNAISKVAKQRSALGAVQNRLEHTIANLDNVVENTTSAESRIRDTDMAEEMVAYSKNSILQQAGQSMLAQANQANQGVLSLLQ